MKIKILQQKNEGKIWDYTYCFSIQIIDATVQMNAGPQMRGHIHWADWFVEKRKWLVGGCFFAILNFIVFGGVGEWRRELLPKVLWI